MPPKNIISKEKIIEKAFEVLRKEGFDAITARRVAKELGISTMPIYCHFKSIEELKEILLKKAHELLLTYQLKNYTGESFLDTGIGYIKFALEERVLFRECFMKRQSGSEFVERATGAEIIKVMKKVEYLKELDEKQLEEILFRLWIFTFGLAALVNTGFIENPSDEFIIKLLDEGGMAIIEFEKNR
ncbi:MAG: TetR/AcrR family transcriptional regulator [Brevinematia bacterium]